MATNTKPTYAPRIIVKLQDSVVLPYDRSVNDEIDLPFWNRLRRAYGHITIEPLLISVEPDKVSKLAQLASRLNSGYKPPNFLTYFAIDTQGNETKTIFEMLRNNFSEIEYVYIEPTPSKRLEPEEPNTFKPTPKPNQSMVQEQPKRKADYPSITTFNFTASNIELEQKYLKCSPMGVGLEEILPELASLANPQAAAEQNNYFFDLERGWALHHLDLNLDDNNLVIPESDEAIHAVSNEPLEVIHGTSTLGVVSSIHNSYGTKGLAYHTTTPHAVCTHILNHSRPLFTVENSILSVLCLLLNKYKNDEPDAFTCSILLIEEQLNLSGKNDIAVEAAPAIYEMIKLATALGVSVIEAAGNGGHRLDNILPVVDNFQHEDSGAIIVGAAKSESILPNTLCNDLAITWQKVTSSCHGRRVNCFAWGSDVVTLATKGSDNEDPFGANLIFANDLYRDNFSGTSSASAIIAGVALVIQKMAYQSRTAYLEPDELRELLSNPDHGVTNTDGTQIGVMPDLKRIIANLG